MKDVQVNANHSRRLSRLAIVLAISLVCLSPTLARAVSLAGHNPAIEPTDRLGESWWAQRHQALLQAAKSQPDTQLLLIGDSITNN